jgi:hypothetical protein
MVGSRSLFPAIPLSISYRKVVNWGLSVQGKWLFRKKLRKWRVTEVLHVYTVAMWSLFMNWDQRTLRSGRWIRSGVSCYENSYNSVSLLEQRLVINTRLCTAFLEFVRLSPEQGQLSCLIHVQFMPWLDSCSIVRCWMMIIRLVDDLHGLLFRV